MNVLGLFSGIGGFELGLERAGFRIAAMCECDQFCRRVLAKHWPGVPCYDDVRTLTAERLRADRIGVDVVCGGFPCQDISLAGNRSGLDGVRSGLWREFARILGELRPRYAIVENTAGLLSLGIADIIGELASLGYAAEWDCLPTALPYGHRRDRVFVVAHHHRQGFPWSSEGRTVIKDALRIFSRERFASILAARSPTDRWHDHQPMLGRGISRIPERVDRVRSLGNSVVPQIVTCVGGAILDAERRAA